MSGPASWKLPLSTVSSAGCAVEFGWRPPTNTVTLHGCSVQPLRPAPTTTASAFSPPSSSPGRSAGCDGLVAVHVKLPLHGHPSHLAEGMADVRTLPKGQKQISRPLL